MKEHGPAKGSAGKGGFGSATRVVVILVGFVPFLASFGSAGWYSKPQGKATL
ncbi:hypothetical protein LY78DRAFT_659055 [Colletotrichum sublineola]|nr:hypothetical protein LY78DRAFT_659055 [Colletotrichum sublineola]